jgi:hypothetical protein
MVNSLKDLNFCYFKNIKNFNEKISKFLDDLNEELKFWRGYIEKNGKRSIRYPVTGIACLDKEDIVAIAYFVVPKKLSPRWIYDRLFRPKGLEYGIVVKKEYHRKGIANHLSNLKLDLLHQLGYDQYWFRIDIDNIPSMQLAKKYLQKVNGKIWKKTRKQVYFLVDTRKSFRNN